MMKRVVIATTFLSSIGVALGGPEARQYEVRLVRPAAVGDEYRMQATCRQSQKMKIIRGGQEVQHQDTEFSLYLEAGVKVLEVSGGGYATRFTLAISKFTKTQGGAEAVLIPSGSLLAGSVTDAGYGFEVSGRPVTRETTESLAAVIQLGKGGRWSDDEIYESGQLQAVGSTWKINAAVAARNLAKMGLMVQVSDITGTATLAEVTEIDSVPCLKVDGKMFIKGMAAPLIPDFTVEAAEMHMAYSATFPVDIARGRLGESQEMKMTCSMRGQPDANGTEVTVQSTAERVVTTKMSYRK